MSNNPLKVAYVTTYDARDMAPYSGTGYRIAEALKNQKIEMDYVGPLQEAFSLYFKARQYLYGKVLKTYYPRDREPPVLNHYARQIEAKLRHSSPDIVFSPGGIPITRLNCKQPIVIWADATFEALIDFYFPRSTTSAEFIRKGNAQEQEALERCAVTIFSSDWAAQSAIRLYNVSAGKIRVVPYGANIDCTHTLQDVERSVDARPHECCRLLLLGVDWQRKGCDDAIEIARALNAAGLKTQLTIAGCDAPAPVPDFVTVAGFISKKTPEGSARIRRLLSESHFMLLPTRAECAAVVFAEASAFGLPNLAPIVGGIPTVVRDGANGKTFPPASFNVDCARYILDLSNDRKRYRELALSSFEEYRTRLNWNAAGAKVLEILEEVRQR